MIFVTQQFTKIEFFQLFVDIMKNNEEFMVCIGNLSPAVEFYGKNLKFLKN